MNMGIRRAADKDDNEMQKVLLQAIGMAESDDEEESSKGKRIIAAYLDDEKKAAARAPRPALQLVTPPAAPVRPAAPALSYVERQKLAKLDRHFGSNSGARMEGNSLVLGVMSPEQAQKRMREIAGGREGREVSVAEVERAMSRLRELPYQGGKR
jgi:hypothetical protein